MKRLPICLLAALCACVTPTGRAEESLFDRSRARRLSAQEQPFFGPRSASLRYDERMIRAVQIAQGRAHARTTWRCWAYVKDALLAANLVKSRPTTAYAKQAGGELVDKYGFRKLASRDPWRAPVGAVVVYGGDDAGHVELRTTRGFVSDFVSATPYPRPVLGIYIKPS